MWIVRARERSRREEADPFPWRNTTEFGNAWIDETWPEQERQIRAIRDTAARFGARTAVVVFPLESQLSEKALELDRAYTLKPQRMLSEIAARLAIPLLDLYEPFHARAGENLFRSLSQTTPVSTGERRIAGGYLELSGVQPTTEMMELIEASRAFESNVRLLQGQDEAIEQLLSRVLRQP